jgi:hypothetical protein
MSTIRSLFIGGLVLFVLGCDSGKKVVIPTGTLATPSPNDLVSSGGGKNAPATGGGADSPDGK